MSKDYLDQSALPPVLPEEESLLESEFAVKIRITSVATGVVALAGAVLASASLANAAGSLGWHDYRGISGVVSYASWEDGFRDSGSDMFDTKVSSAANPDVAEFKLHTSSNVTWLKDIFIVDTSGKIVSNVSQTMNGNHNGATITIPNNYLDGVHFLAFEKAGFLGAPYVDFQVPLRNDGLSGPNNTPGASPLPSMAAGKHFDITWTRD